jgi:hypothetical protein
MDTDWTILDNDLYKLLATQSPKRRGIYKQQLINDLKSLKMLFGFISVAILIYYGFHNNEYLVVGTCLILVAGYLYLFIKITNEHINSHIIEGKITSIGKSHPVMESISITEAEVFNGEKSIPISIKTHPTSELLNNFRKRQ